MKVWGAHLVLLVSCAVLAHEATRQLLPLRTANASRGGIAQDGIAQDGIAQDGIAQDGIAQDGIAQGGIAQDAVDPQLQPALDVILARLGDKTPETDPTGDDWRNDPGFIAAVNRAMHADGTGIAPEVMARMNLPDARLAQWLMLNFTPDQLNRRAGPGARALRTLNHLVSSAVQGTPR